MGAFYSGTAWRFLLRLLGGTQLFAGILALLLTGLDGSLVPTGAAGGLLMTVCGWLMLSRRVCPGFVQNPQSGLAGFGALMIVLVLALGGPLAAMMLLGAVGSSAVVLPIFPLGVVGLLSSIFILPVAAMAPFMGRQQKRTLAKVAAVRADPALLSSVARLLGWSHWFVTRLAGLILLPAIAWISYDFFTGGTAWSLFIFDARKTVLLMIVLPLIAAWMTLPVPMTKNLAMHVPLERKNVVAQLLFFAPVVALGIYWFLPVYPLMLIVYPVAVIAPIVDLAMPIRQEIAIGFGVTLAVLSLLAFSKRPKGLPEGEEQDAPLVPHSGSRVGSDMPEVERKPDMSKGKLPEPKLPSIGAAMKLYIAADWIVMRLLGAGLLWTGYILWQLIEAERWSRALVLSYGFNPMHALYAYAGIGALMAVPFLLPRFITAPRHVAGGLLKAVLLVVAALTLLPMLHVAIELYTPDIYWATLHATVPSVFKGVAAIAVTSALLISFFRQLGRTPKVDYSGKPVQILSGQELRDLREARATR